MLALLESDVKPKEIPSLIEAQTNSAIELMKAKAEVDLMPYNERRKNIAFGLSFIAILTPLIPGAEPITVYPIASLGAVGFATSLYSIFGKNAFEAGKKFRNFFDSSKRR